MRKIPFSLLLLFSLACAPVARAQVTIGVFGDLNLAAVSGDAPKDFSYGGNSGFGFGLIGEFQIADDVWLSLQPMTSKRGAGISYKFEGDEDPTQIGDLNLSYFAVPILAKFTTAGSRVYITSGVDVAFLTSANLTSVAPGAEEIDVQDAFKSYDVGLDFGVGGQLPVGPVWIMLEARYEQGIINIADEEISEDALKTRLRSSGLQLFAGVLLPLGGGR
jgi:Outer membrane protein beta-barrel domain